MTLGDGDKVTTTGQWRQRREEMKRILEYYAVGRMLTEEDWSAMLDFADKHLRGMRVDRAFDRFLP
jgi:hypothetical protein